MRSGIATILLFLLIQLSMPLQAMAQKQLVSSVDFDESLVYYRPRIALSASGAYAVSWEVLKKLEAGEEWQIGLQRFTPVGNRMDTNMHLSPAQFCNPFAGDALAKMNEPESVERGLRNVEMDFSAEGLLMLSMEQFQVYRENGSEEPAQLSGTRVSVLDEQGQEITPAPQRNCAWTSSHLARPAAPGKASSSQADADVSAFGDIHYASTSIEDRFLAAPSMNASAGLWPQPTRPVARQRAGSGELPLENALTSSFQQWSSDAIRKVTLRQSGAIDMRVGEKAIAANPAGQTVAVWVDFSNGEDGRILGLQFDALGDPVGSVFEITTATDVVDAEEGSRPEVAMLEDGRFLVVWTAHGKDGMRAWGRYFNAGGIAETEPFLLDPDDTVASGFPDVTSNGNQFAYTWLVDQQGVTSVFANLPGITNVIDQAPPEASASLAFKGYPNPFIEKTTLEYVLKTDGPVTLIVYDLLGREIKKVVDRPQGPGAYRIELDGADFAAGYYMARLQQGNLSQTQLLVRTE